ncbi:hypothetical protein FS842_008315, partial [Serendipita sp. 407]
MSALHAYFQSRKQKEFQKCLEQARTATSSSTNSQLMMNSSSSSGPSSRSWTKFPTFGSQIIDVNARDCFGRTVLHLACSAIDPAALECGRLLLAHAGINVNIQDYESHWTPLHRALYAGNIPIAVLLLQRPDIDMYQKDIEGYTPFDVYNSTVDGTNPVETDGIVSLALGQDHTLVVTSSGEVLSWGLNRFGQLGYVIEGSSKAIGEQVQAAARKITGPLRNQIVFGAACCKTASVCWTSTQLFTWGTNSGQLGYEKTTHPQILPRLVPSIVEPVSGVAITETTMLVLLKNGEVICFHDGTYWKLFFPSQRAHKALGKDKAGIRKVIAGDGSVGQFALVSRLGDVYLFNTEDYSSARKDTKDTSSRPIPQPVWAVRKQFTAVKDVALGADGSLILCTKSGHVFVRSRVLRASLAHAPSVPTALSKGGSSFKFQRVNHLQRVIRVCANGAGSFAALRLDATPRPLSLAPKTFMGDLEKIMPFKCYLSQYATKVLSNAEAFANEATIHHLTSSFANDVDDDETPDIDIAHDIRAAMEMCEYLTRMPVVGVSVQASTTNTSFAPDFGADLQLKTGEFVLPIHRIILSTCAPILKTALQGGRLQLTDSDKRHVFNFNGNGKSGGKSSVIGVKGCHPMTILSLCHYLYSDKVIAIWDRR